MKFISCLFGLILILNIITINSRRRVKITHPVEHKLVNYKDQSPNGWPAKSCAGERNSPIDIPTKTYKFDTSPHLEIISSNYPTINGLTMEIEHNEKYHIKIPTETYIGELMVKKNGILYRYLLIDVNFHYRSEHTFDGQHADVELHMVHSKDLKYLADNHIKQPADEAVNTHLVVATLFNFDGKIVNNEKFEFGLDELTYKPTPIKNLELKNFSSPKLAYYHYIGGLTTPNCDEVVNWVVNSEVLKISESQVSGIYMWIGHLYPDGNERKTQPLNGRIIYKHVPKTSKKLKRKFRKNRKY